MNEYYLLGKLSNHIMSMVNSLSKEYFDKHHMNYSLLYPLAAIELGCMKDVPHSTANLLKRCVSGYIYSQYVKDGKEIKLGVFNQHGFNKYLKSYNEFLLPLYQNYRFAREINDINYLTKPKLSKTNEHEYVLTSSLVTNKYREENFYFYGIDDTDAIYEERKQIDKLIMSFYKKVFIEMNGFSKLLSNIDVELYNLCVKIIEKDLNKWQSNVRSSVFVHPQHLALVLGYFYYYSKLKSMSNHLDACYTNNVDDLAANMIMRFDKEKAINDIEIVSKLKKVKIERIINYLTNKGNMNFLEFPLFEIEKQLITIPSLIMTNDWSFTIINGHYTKDIAIDNREKTISTITENRIEKVLKNTKNIVMEKVIPYTFIDENNIKQDSDIDYAIYDKIHNMLLIIEAKWIDNHYIDEIDIRYGRVLNTINKIYNKQMSKHKKFLTKKENIEFIFSHNHKFELDGTMPEIKYLAVDKRNQLHIDNRHMISEYMLMYLLKKYVSKDILDLPAFWAEIETLETKVEYIKVSDKYNKFKIDDENVILVEENDITLNLKC